MRDLDDLLTGEVGRSIGRSAGESARVPDFDRLAARGRRRRTQRRTAVAGVAALVVVGVVGAGQWVGTDHRATDPDPVAPAPDQRVDRSDQIHWTKPDAAAQQQARAVIEDPDAIAVAGAVDPANPASRAVLWQTCDDPCDALSMAVAVTDDGFATRTSVPFFEAASVRPVGNGVFLADNFEPGEAPTLVSTHGTVQVEVDGVESPVADGEVVVALHGSGLPILGLVAVDPATGRGHRVPLPDGAVQGWSQSGPALTVLTGTRDLSRSSDGGRTWATTRIPDPGRAFVWMVPSAEASTAAVILGGDGSTYPSLEAVVRLRAGSDPESIPQDTPPWAYFSGAGVLPDGRLLVAVNGWSDATEHAEGERGEEVTPSGVYVSNDDWSHFEQVPDVLEGEAPLASFATTVDGTLSLVVTPEGGSSMMFSTDGDVWQNLSTR